MKYDTWDNMCDFPVTELSVLIGDYVTHVLWTTQICGFIDGWNGKNNRAL